MTTTINASPSNGLVQTADGSGILKVQSNGVTTNALAWVNFNGTGTVAIRGSFNVSSITDNGTGDYTVNFTNALADANYSLVMTTNFGASNAFTSTAPSTTAARVNSTNSTTGVATDLAWIGVSIFR